MAETNVNEVELAELVMEEDAPDVEVDIVVVEFAVREVVDKAL